MRCNCLVQDRGTYGHKPIPTEERTPVVRNGYVAYSVYCANCKESLLFFISMKNQTFCEQLSNRCLRRHHSNKLLVNAACAVDSHEC